MKKELFSITRHKKLADISLKENGEGICVYEKMRDEGLEPDISIVLTALKVCSKSRNLQTGTKIHLEVAQYGYESNVYVANTLVDMYAKCGVMSDARRVFDKMVHHTTVSWNAVMMGYAENGEAFLALELYSCMRHQGCLPNSVTFLALLKACGNLAVKEDERECAGKAAKAKCLEMGRAIHNQIVKNRDDSKIYIDSALVDMYAKCGSMVEARTVFEKMTLRDVISWNAIILGYSENGEGRQALQLYAIMQEQGCVPNRVTFHAALKACATLAADEEAKEVGGKLLKADCLKQGKSLHDEAVKSGYGSDIYLRNTLIDMYGKCGSMKDANMVFDTMLHPDVASWTAIISGYVVCGEGEVALQLFKSMQDQGFKPNYVTFLAALQACGIKGCFANSKAIHEQYVKRYNLNIYVASTLVDMYAKCGSMAEARKVFDRMKNHDVVLWNALIFGYAENKEYTLSLELYRCMWGQSCMPNSVTFAAALKACANLAVVDIGRKLQADIRTAGIVSDSLWNWMVDFYGKCGSMVEAQDIFDSMQTKNLVTWNALMVGYSRQGEANQVFILFKSMLKERLQPDGITFLSVLTVCSHVGLVEEAKECFRTMCLDYGMVATVEHYTCIVDLLGRVNQLEDAVAVLQKMPLEPDIVMWATVLNACQKWANVEVAKLAFESILLLDDQNATAYMLMANIYAAAGMWEESEEILAMPRSKQSLH